jgi:hypothetical protein
MSILMIIALLTGDNACSAAGYYAWRGVLQAEDDPAFVEQLQQVSHDS